MVRHQGENWQTFLELITLLKSQHGQSVAFQYKQGEEVAEKTFQDFYHETYQLALGLNQVYGQGQRVAIIGKTSYEWLVTYVATIISGGVAVPLDSQLSLKAVETLFERAEIDLVFYDEGFRHHQQLTDPRWQYIGMNGCGDSEHSWGSLGTIDEAALPETVSEETAVILYTSGTTGQSKGVCLSQKGILAVVRDSTKLILMEKGDKALSVLPVNHAYELHCGIFPMLSVGGTIAINDSLRNINANLHLFKPNSLFIVPLIAEMFYQKIWEQAEQTGKATSLRKAIKLNKGLKKIKMDVSSRLFKPIKASLGGELKRIVSGGAKLNPKIAEGFADLGFLFSEGYGITECGPLVSVNPEWAAKTGSLGKPLENCQVKIVEGEIVVKGDVLANGYYQDERATAEAFPVLEGERWFKTGDLGSLDDEGYLYISGRKKNLIILANGENVSPEELEITVSNIEGIKEVVVYQKEQKIVANIFPAEEYLAADGEETLSYFKLQLNQINKELPVYQRISGVEISQKEFEKTTTKKIKRETAMI